MATQPSLNLNRKETCWAIPTTIKIHQMREEFGEKIQKPVKTLVRKNVCLYPHYLLLLQLLMIEFSFNFLLYHVKKIMFKNPLLNGIRF